MSDDHALKSNRREEYPVLREDRKSTNIHANPGFIWGMSVHWSNLRNKVLRDDRTSGEGPGRAARNVLGEALEICSIKPMTGFYRDGCCNTGREDIGSHTVCVVMTSAFLEFSKSRGNDLSTPGEFGFPGLKPGDRWCLCATRWQEALDANQAPRVVLRATHDGALVHCSLGDLKRFAVDLA
jgi:uncharacterized protein (DUF2237 family)